MRQSRRLYDFKGDDAAYIQHLEQRLSVWETRRRSCALAPELHHRRRALGPGKLPPTVSPPSLPPSSGGLHVQTEKELVIIPYQLPDAQASTDLARESKPDWLYHADRLIQKVPHAQKWMKRWKSYGIDSVRDNESAINVFLGASQSTLPHSACSEFKDTNEGVRAALIASATQYSSLIKSFGVAAGLHVCLAGFQELVFVSLCNVLLHYGVAEDDVNTIMRNNISNSQPKNLKRLRSGATWVNKLINHLKWLDWGDRAFDLFVFWGKGIKQYGRFADCANQSCCYFVSQLSAKEYTAGPVYIDGWTSFSIPLLIKKVIGTSLTEVQIAEPLGYTMFAPERLVWTGWLTTQHQGAVQTKKRRRLDNTSTATASTDANTGLKELLMAVDILRSEENLGRIQDDQPIISHVSTDPPNKTKSPSIGPGLNKVSENITDSNRDFNFMASDHMNNSAIDLGFTPETAPNFELDYNLMLDAMPDFGTDYNFMSSAMPDFETDYNVIPDANFETDHSYVTASSSSLNFDRNQMTY